MGLTYESAAMSIRKFELDAARRDNRKPKSVCSNYLALIARGEKEPSAALARSIVAWSGGRVVMGDLIRGM